MNASIIAVGTELLFGSTINTNASYISEQLQELNIDVMYHYTVGDNPNRVKNTIELALKETELVITTGGLGPTQDDLTKEIICEVMGEELVQDEKLLIEMKEFFNKLGREMTKNNEKQCYLPKNSTMLENTNGTAPGFIIEKNGKTIIALPGPPREMKAMFTLGVYPYLREKGDGFLYYKMIRTIGIGESSLETELLDLIEDYENVTVATYAKTGECMLRVAAKMDTEEEAKKAVENVIKKIEDRVGKYIYAKEDIDLKEVVSTKLVKNNITISVAESCTGGKFVGQLIEYPGISKVLDRGIVTYSNKAKIEELGVNPKTLDEFGAVSRETAIEMAEGLKEKTLSDITVAVTGIAGPDGGSEEKPVGLIYIAVSYKGETKVNEIKLINNGRESVRNQATLRMFDLVNRSLQ